MNNMIVHKYPKSNDHRIIQSETTLIASQK